MLVADLMYDNSTNKCTAAASALEACMSARDGVLLANMQRYKKSGEHDWIDSDNMMKIKLNPTPFMFCKRARCSSS
jgi:hypothetical protein